MISCYTSANICNSLSMLSNLLQQLYQFCIPSYTIDNSIKTRSSQVFIWFIQKYHKIRSRGKSRIFLWNFLNTYILMEGQCWPPFTNTFSWNYSLQWIHRNEQKFFHSLTFFRANTIIECRGILFLSLAKLLKLTDNETDTAS